MKTPYEPVEESKSKSGDIVKAPSNGEAIGIRLTDEKGGYSGYLIEWKHNSDAWICGDNNVSLSGEV